MEHTSGSKVLHGQWYKYVNSRIYLAQEAPQPLNMETV